MQRRQLPEHFWRSRPPFMCWQKDHHGIYEFCHGWNFDYCRPRHQILMGYRHGCLHPEFHRCFRVLIRPNHVALYERNHARQSCQHRHSPQLARDPFSQCYHPIYNYSRYQHSIHLFHRRHINNLRSLVYDNLHERDQRQITKIN